MSGIARTRKDQKQYQKDAANSPDGCVFCEFAKSDEQVLEVRENF